MARKQKKKAVVKTSPDFLDELHHFQAQTDNVHPRSYYLSTPWKIPSLTQKHKCYLLFLVISSLSIRLYNYDAPSTLGYGEKDTIGLLNNYIGRKFQLTTQGPLVPLVFSKVTKFLGYDGIPQLHEYNFPPFFPVKFVRFLTAIQGVVAIILTYLILHVSRCSAEASLAGALTLALDPANIVTNKFFNPDPFALAALASAVYFTLKLDSTIPFTPEWLKRGHYLGISLGLLVSTKFTGALTILWSLAVALKRAWLIVGDMSLKDKRPFSYIFASLCFCVAVPLLIFITINAASLATLTQISSSSDVGFSYMHSTFQANLIGNDLGTSPQNMWSNISLNVVSGSTVSIRHVDSLGGYLFSHNVSYPRGPEDQYQVYLNNLKDKSNLWQIEFFRNHKAQANRKVYITDGVYVKLRNIATGKYLHVSDKRGPVSEQDYHFEVSAAGDEDHEPDRYSEWSISYDTDYLMGQKYIDNSPGDGIIHPLASGIRIYNRALKCKLISHPVQLPDWGNYQQEVVCVKSASNTRSLFYIEQNILPDNIETNNEPFVLIHKYNIFEKVYNYFKSAVELAKHYKMYMGSTTTFESVPEDWVYKSHSLEVQGYSANGYIRISVVYFTSRFIQLCGLLVIVGYTGFVGLSILSQLFHFRLQAPKPKRPDLQLELEKLRVSVLDFSLGWIIHFVPYFLCVDAASPRYYLPAYFFLILLTGRVSGAVYGGPAIALAAAVYVYREHFTEIYGL